MMRRSLQAAVLTMLMACTPLAQNAQERQLLQERATAQSRLESFKPRDQTAG